jgi:1-deoxy-D-xylulose-5-phosphate reductoisomerase
VQAFLDERIRFDQIHAVNQSTLSEIFPTKPMNLGDLLAIDAQSREAALAQVKRFEV